MVLLVLPAWLLILLTIRFTNFMVEAFAASCQERGLHPAQILLKTLYDVREIGRNAVFTPV